MRAMRLARAARRARHARAFIYPIIFIRFISAFEALLPSKTLRCRHDAAAITLIISFRHIFRRHYFHYAIHLIISLITFITIIFAIFTPIATYADAFDCFIFADY
jgi:hypothetical protein